MPNDIDSLMDEDPLNLSAQQIDAIIQYERNHQANYVPGARAKKETGPKQAVPSSILDALLKKAPGPAIKRRI